jgi:hypothetical protein
MIQAVIRGCDTNHDISNIGQVNKELLRLFPNPAREWITVEVFNNAVYYGQLFKPNGQLVKKLSMEYGINTFDISELEAGLYFIFFYTSEGTIVQKVIKTN